MKKVKGRFLKSTLALALTMTSIPAIALSSIKDVSAVGKEESYTKYVDPFVSTEVDYGQLFPGSVVPNGLVKLSPDTYPHATLDHAGYDYKKTQIQGFSHTRIEGVGGQGAGGDVLVTPTYVQYTERPKAETRAMKYEKSTEKAKPGYYKAELTPKTGKDSKVADNNEMGKIIAEMTSDERTGFHQYTFPQAGNVNLLVDLNYTYHGTDVRNGTLDVLEESNEKTAIGGRFSGRNVGGSGKYTMYFYMETSKPVNNVKTWNGNQLSSKASQKGNDLGAVLNFDVKDNEELQVKVSISPISVDQAKIDMGNEIDDWNFDAVYKRADKAWNEVLSKIRIETSKKSDPTGELKQLFYTHLYHMFMTPMNATSTTGIYRGTDGEIHEAKDYTHYDSWTLWDDYRKYPMIGLVLPDVYKDMVRSIANALDNGIVTWSHDKQPVPNVRTEHAVALLVDGVAKGLVDIENLEEAYEAAKKIANKVITPDVEKIGYVKNRVDQTIEYSYDDWALSLIADALGKKDEAKYFLNRSFNYKNMYRKDAVKSPFSDKKLGLLWNRDEKGNWLNQDPNSMSTGLYQGSMWQYTWYGSNDVNGMMDLMGGKENMLEALQYLFGEHDPDNGKAMQHNAANEVELHAPYLFNFAGRPDKTQQWVRQIYTKETWNTGYASGAVKEKMYKLSPQGYLETMDDDAGTMAMMFVSAAMGIFPMTPGDTTFQIGSPFFEKVSLDVGNGKTFNIVSNNVSPDNMYIQSAKFNGKSFDRTWVDYSEITRGGTLTFEMGDTPSTWAQNGVPAKSSSDSADTSTYDKDEIAYSTAMLEESKLNDGSIDQKLDITLKTKEFNGELNEDLIATGKIKISNVPKGLKASALLKEKNKVEIKLSGKAEKHKLDDSIGNLKIELSNQATKNEINDSIRKVKDNVKVMFSDDKLTYSSKEFKESVNDDGSITSTSTIQLTGDAILSGKVNEDFVKSGKVALENVPEGLKPRVIKTGDKTAVLSFEGKSKKHDIDIEFSMSFFDKAFDGATSSQVENSSTGGMSALLLKFYYNKTTELKKAVAKAKLIDEDVYTKGTYKVLKDIIQEAEQLLNSKTIDNNKEITNLLTKLDSALNNLQLPTDGLKVLEGEKSDEWSAGDLKNEATNLGGTYDGAWVKYTSLDFADSNADTINIRYDNNSLRCAPDSKVEVRKQDATGDLLATVDLVPTGLGWGNYKTVSVKLNQKLDDLQDICFVLKGTTITNPFIANIDYFQFSDGVIVQEKVKLEAEASHNWSGGTLKNEATNLGGTYDNAWISYNNVDLTGVNANTVSVRYATRNDACATDARIEVRLGDKDGALLGTANMPLTTGWSDYQIASINLNQTLNGNEDLCFVLRGTTDATRKYIANVDYMEFSNVSINSHIEAEDRSEWSGGELKTESSTDTSGNPLTNVGGTRDGSYLAYNNVNFDGSGLTEMTIRYSHNPSSAGTNSRADIYLDDMTGTPIGTVLLPTTNGWANYTPTTIKFDKPISGKHKVYLKLRTDGANKWVANIDWIEFKKEEKTIEVDKTKLISKYDSQESLLKSTFKYDVIGFNHFKNAMHNASSVIDDKKVSERAVSFAIKGIDNSLLALQYRVMYDLLDKVIDMDAIMLKGYTKDSLQRFEKALKSAKRLDTKNTYEEYTSAYNTLLDAHSTLTLLNKDALDIIITRAEAIDLTLYLSKQKDEFTQALENAKTIFNQELLLQGDVDNAVERLDKAILQLQLKAVKAELEKVIKEAEGLKENSYTKESFNQLKKSLAQAKTIYENGEATQEEVNKVVELLKTSIHNLKGIPPIITNKPDQKPGQGNGVQTGDQTYYGLYVMMVIGSGLGYLTLRRKKYE